MNLKIMYAKWKSWKKLVHTVLFHPYKILEYKNICSDQKDISGCLGTWGRGWKEGLQRGIWKLLEMMNMLNMLNDEYHYLDCGESFMGIRKKYFWV